MTLGQRFWIGFQKCFRGLVAEPREGWGWEISKGNVAFWMVLGHCMFIWSKFDPTDPGQKMDVSPGELTFLLALLGYAGMKVGSDMVKTVAALKQGANPNVVAQNKPAPPLTSEESKEIG